MMDTIVRGEEIGEPPVRQKAIYRKMIDLTYPINFLRARMISFGRRKRKEKRERERRKKGIHFTNDRLTMIIVVERRLGSVVL